MVEGDYGLVPYKDISELKKELEEIRAKKELPAKELYDAVQRLTQTMTEMLEVFGAAAEQMKTEEKEYESEAKKHDTIISKLDKLIDQNKTIAEGMVAIVDMVKENLAAPAKEQEESFFKPKPEQKLQQEWQPQPEPKAPAKPTEGMWQPQPEPRLFAKQPQAAWQPKPEPSMQRMQPAMAQPVMPPEPNVDVGMPEFGAMPQMEPAPMPDFDFPEEPLPFEEHPQPKKKGLFGLFKK